MSESKLRGGGILSDNSKLIGEIILGRVAICNT